MELFDIHTHVISPDRELYPLAPLAGRQSSWSRDRSLTGSELLAAMDDAGIARAAVVHASTAYGFDDRLVADTIDQDPSGRLVGIGSIDICAPDAVTDLEYWIEARGLSGIRVFSTGSTMPQQGEWLDSPATWPVWAWAESRGLPVCVQIRPEGVPMVTALLERFPHLTLVLDHAGQPDLRGGPPYPHGSSIFGLAAYPNVLLKITNDNFERSQAFPGGARGLVRALVERFGAERIAWGTNFPATAGRLSDLVDAARHALGELAPVDQEQILGGTAVRLYGVLRGRTPHVVDPTDTERS